MKAEGNITAGEARGDRQAAGRLCGQGDAVIRQAISCDICGTEKKQTNHWFVAYDQGGELRVSGWNSRNRLRAGSKHLCGQTCLHKLVDEFMARSLSVRSQSAVADEVEAEKQAAPMDASLTSDAPYEDVESTARLITPPVVPVIAPLAAASIKRPPVPVISAQAGPVAVPARLYPEAPPKPAAEEAPGYASRNWRAEAWEREREREMRSADGHPGVAIRRRSNS